jgi:hypothetical protein
MPSHQHTGAIHRPAVVSATATGYAPSSTKPSDFDTIDWHALNHEAAQVPRSSQVAHLVVAKPALIFCRYSVLSTGISQSFPRFVVISKDACRSSLARGHCEAEHSRAAEVQCVPSTEPQRSSEYLPNHSKKEHAKQGRDLYMVVNYWVLCTIGRKHRGDQSC